MGGESLSVLIERSPWVSHQPMIKQRVRCHVSTCKKACVLVDVMMVFLFTPLGILSTVLCGWSCT